MNEARRHVSSSTTATVRILTFALILAAPLRAQSEAGVPDSASASSRSRIASITTIVRDGTLEGIRWPRLGAAADELERAYAARDWAPLWSTDGTPTAASRAMIETLRRVTERGLEPSDYDVARLATMVTEGLRAPGARAEFDATLSVASLRVLRALRTGRVTAHESGSRTREDSVDFAAILGALASSAAPSEVLDAQEPQFDQYRRLKQAYVDYATQSTLDLEASARARAIALSLERWRQLPVSTAQTQIIVNIPAFDLQVLQVSGDSVVEVLQMDVVVGTAFRNQTPAFSDSMQYIVFSPYWDVPASIARTELVGIGMRDPYLLAMNNYQFVNRKGRIVEPSLAAVRAVKAGTARIRQLPGGTNSLGRVKFMFPNKYDIYLHDSPVASAFSRERRDASHGCIRLADPAALARLLLRDVKGWDSTAVDKAMRLSTPQRVNLTRAVPVHLMYATAVVEKDGRVIFHDDIYGRDADLAAELSRGYPYRAETDDASAPVSRPK